MEMEMEKVYLFLIKLVLIFLVLNLDVVETKSFKRRPTPIKTISGSNNMMREEILIVDNGRKTSEMSDRKSRLMAKLSLNGDIGTRPTGDGLVSQPTVVFAPNVNPQLLRLESRTQVFTSEGLRITGSDLPIQSLRLTSNCNNNNNNKVNTSGFNAIKNLTEITVEDYEKRMEKAQQLMKSN